MLAMQNRIDELVEMQVKMAKDIEELSFQIKCFHADRQARIQKKVDQHEAHAHIASKLRAANALEAIAEGLAMDNAD